ncbi:hypothetical protein COCNU_03G010260 [Cocos nucifera]|uniref:DNA mismatch repair protein MSH2 n=1 Tax=Cocos nucifera TaxID=13894 RepID=A0A8K0I300_COCNU|nr:hypothetical protein COCNU_03G010260 [Cocos nucifera]
MFETIARDLLLERTDHTLEFYEGSGSNWRLTKTGTPGNIGSFEDVLFANNDMQDTPVTISLFPIFRENQYTVGLSFVDITKQKLGLAEFLDDSQFTNVEAVMVALGCKECLLPMESGKSVEFKALHGVLTKCNVLLTERKKSEFKSRDLVQDLSRIIRGSTEPVRDLLSEFEHALCALGALISYAELLADDGNYGCYTIEKYNLDSYMRLDSAAMRALNVLENKTDLNKNFSLFGLMNRTCTAGMGKRLLNRWLKQPLLDVDAINCRLDLVQAFVEDAELRQGLRLHLKRISDIERLTHNLKKKTANLQPVIKLYQSSIRLPHIKDVLEHYEGQFSPLIRNKYLDPLQRWMNEDGLNKFIALVEVAIDLDQLENGGYMISPKYNRNLAALKEQLNAVEQQIQNLHKQTANDLDLSLDKTLKLERGTQFGHVFRITKKEEQKVRKKLSTHYIVLETRKDGVKFTNSKLKRLGDQYQKVLSEYTSCQKVFVAQVVDTTASFSEVFETLSVILSELDVLLSFADLATSCPIPYVRPDITPSIIFAKYSRRTVLRFVCFGLSYKIDLHHFDDSDYYGLNINCDYHGSTPLGLAWAICEYLVQVTRAPTLFATHFHELTALAHVDGHEPHSSSNLGVANYHVGAHIDPESHKLTMLYKVEPGACDQSFGIHVAEFANFPEAVVTLARSKAEELEDFSETFSINNDLKEEVGSKRKRACSPDDIARGAARAHKFLQQFSALPLDQMDWNEAMEQINKLRSVLEKDAAGCPWLQQFF